MFLHLSMVLFLCSRFWLVRHFDTLLVRNFLSAERGAHCFNKGGACHENMDKCGNRLFIGGLSALTRLSVCLSLDKDKIRLLGISYRLSLFVSPEEAARTHGADCFFSHARCLISDPSVPDLRANPHTHTVCGVALPS